MAAEEVYAFDVTVPAGTPIASPVTLATTMLQRIIESISWNVPPGALGVVGFQFAVDGVPLIPHSIGQWLIRSGESGATAVEGQPTSGKWTIIAYNTGNFAHTIHVEYRTRILRPQPAPLTIASNYALSRYDPAADDPPSPIMPMVGGDGYGY